jgi:hypothetical protein
MNTTESIDKIACKREEAKPLILYSSIIIIGERRVRKEERN